MKRWLEWLIDLNDIRLERDAPLSVQWELPAPAWVLLALMLAALGWIAMVYWREKASPIRRAGLAIARLALVGLLVAALCKPTLVLQRNRVETATVALVVDRSLSMAIRDTTSTNGTDDRGGPTRLETAAQSLIKESPSGLHQLLRHNSLQLMTFGSSVETLAMAPKDGSAAGVADALQRIVPDGAATDLGSVLDRLLNRSHGRRLAAIVLASDGRLTSQSRLEEWLHLAADRQIPIYPIRLGSTKKPVDLEISSVKAQGVVFANDILLVEALIVAHGIEESVECPVQLIDELTGEVVDQRTVKLDPSDQMKRVEVAVKPQREGGARYRVRVLPLPDEQRIENNEDVVDTRVLADRLRVLYVEAYPRYEYRYLKNALLREKSIDLSVLLLDADESFVQEGSEPIRRFPETPEELSRYHVILFGDVDPNEGWLTASQMAHLLDFVGQRGGGFGLIAGERSAPHRFFGTLLERLVPVNIDPQVESKNTLAVGYRALPTPAGLESRLLKFFQDSSQNEATLAGLPPLFWTAATLGAKPGSTVLLEDPSRTNAKGTMPLVVLGRYGAGKIFFQATDDSWRWRRHTGELLYDGYWVRVVRELMNTGLAAADRRMVIRTDRRIYPYGEPVRVEVEVLDPRLLLEDQTSIELRIVPAASGDPLAGTSIAQGTIAVERLSPQANLFEGSYLPPSPGAFVLAAPEGSSTAGTGNASATFRVEPPDLELRQTNADHAQLERIASATGGRVLDPGNLASQLGEIRDRSVQIPDDVTESLWDSRLVFVLFVLMISIEWSLRKAFGLL